MIAKGEKVAVVGAGYVGIDAARSAIRLGGEVTCITTESEKAARERVSYKDFDEAVEEGVKFMFGVRVKEIVGKEIVEKIIYENHVKGEMEVTKVICAVGQDHDDDSLKAPLRTDKKGCIEVNEKFQTKFVNVFAAGDCVHGPKTVIHAVDAGRKASVEIIKFLEKKCAEEELGIKNPETITKATIKVDHSNKDI